MKISHLRNTRNSRLGSDEKAMLVSTRRAAYFPRDMWRYSAHSRVEFQRTFSHPLALILSRSTVSCATALPYLVFGHRIIETDLYIYLLLLLLLPLLLLLFLCLCLFVDNEAFSRCQRVKRSVWYSFALPSFFTRSLDVLDGKEPDATGCPIDIVEISQKYPTD